jgi:translation elongation factor EF-G
LSGTIKVGQEVSVLGPSHSSENPDIQTTKIEHLFLMMGNSFNLISEAGPGCVIGIGGLDDFLIKSGTITTCPESCPNFFKIEGLSMGLVKVAIEP